MFKKSGKYIIAVIGFIIILIGIYLLVINNSVSKTNDYLTYTDYFMNYQINYPKDLVITKEDSDSKISNLKSKKFTIFSSKDHDRLFSIGVWDNEDHVDAHGDFVKNNEFDKEYQLDYQSDYLFKEINGVEAFESEITYPFDRKSIKYYTKDSIYVLIYYSERDQTYQDIINSFKLIIK